MFVLAQSGWPEARQVLRRMLGEVEREPGAAGAGHPQSRTVRRTGGASDPVRRSMPAARASKRAARCCRRSCSQATAAVCSRPRAMRRRPSCGARPFSSLACSGGREELWQLYQQEKDVQYAGPIINALFICGGADRLGELATKETDPELRRERHREARTDRKASAPTLRNIYATDKDPGRSKRSVLERPVHPGQREGAHRDRASRRPTPR